jgi:hypothetical protein
MVGTTTTPARVAELSEVCGEVRVLRGSARAELAAATTDADAVVLTVSPRLGRSFDADQRVAEYADTLLATARTAAQVHPRVVFTSSISVWRRSRPGGRRVDRHDRRSGRLTPDVRRRRGGGAGAARRAVVRIPDVHGHPRDIDYPARVRFAHEVLGGSVPFSAAALLYRIEVRDAAAARAFVVEHDLRGVYNAVPDAAVPLSNQEAFAGICAAENLPELTFRDEIRTPTVPVSSARLRAAGFAFAHS